MTIPQLDQLLTRIAQRINSIKQDDLFIKVPNEAYSLESGYEPGILFVSLDKDDTLLFKHEWYELTDEGIWLEILVTDISAVLVDYESVLPRTVRMVFRVTSRRLDLAVHQHKYTCSAVDLAKMSHAVARIGDSTITARALMGMFQVE